MPHVLLITPRYPPYPGGSETYAADLSVNLVRAGWTVTVVTDGSALDAPPDRGDGVRVVRLEAPSAQLSDRRRILWRSLQFGLLDQIHEALPALGAVDLVHANSIEAAILGRMVADELGVALVATIHEHAPQRLTFGAGRCRLVFERLGIDALVAPSEFYRQRAISQGFPAQRIHTVTHGIDAARLRPLIPAEQVRQGWGVARTARVAVLVGRVYEPKGVMQFVHAAYALRSIQDFRAVVVGPDGPGDYPERVRTEIDRLDLHEVFIMDGPRPPEEIGAVINAADIVVAPSLVEGFGLSVVEAMALGKPVVVSDVGGLVEIIARDGDGGLRVPPGDSQALAQALGTLVRERAFAKRVAAAGQARASAFFSAARMADETIVVYENLLPQG